MNDEETIQMDLRGLDQLTKALKGRLPVIRIGILGDKGRVKGKGVTNAEIGAAHEYGAPSRGLPQRSWLRMPLIEHLEKYLEKSGFFDQDLMKNFLKQGSLRAVLEKVQIVAEGVIQDGFASNGFGKWAAWKTPGYESNTGQILKDTQQLSRAVTSEIKE